MAEGNVEPLVTECPNCQTRFRVTESQLQIAAGRVRCGACLTVFQGVEHLLWDDEPQFENDAEAQSALDELLDELDGDSPDLGKDAEPELPDPLPDALGTDDDEEWSEPRHQLYGGHEEPSELAPEELQRIEQTLSGEDFEGADVEVEELVIDQVAEEASLEIVAETVDDPTFGQAEVAPASEPAFAEPAAIASIQREPFAFGEEPTKRRWWVSGAIAGAIAALVAQGLWYQFETWARDPAIRPVYGAICQVLRCELPMLRDIDSMLAQNLVVRSHPEVANALLVDAIIVNQATFVQPFPVLELRFTSLNGNLVAGRRFQPEEYLAGELAGATVMQMRTPIHVELAIEDPGDEAVNYFLSFR